MGQILWARSRPVVLLGKRINEELWLLLACIRLFNLKLLEIRLLLLTMALLKCNTLRVILVTRNFITLVISRININN